MEVPDWRQSEPLTEEEVNEIRERLRDEGNENYPDLWMVGPEDVARLIATVDVLRRALEDVAEREGRGEG